MLRLTVLGGFELTDERGAAVDIRIRKARALLAYLALQADRPVRRETLAALLWGDRPESQARQSLRQALAGLRRALGSRAGLLRRAAETLSLDQEQLQVDALEFQALTGSHDADKLDRAIALYGGTLLAGLELGVPGYEDWLAQTRTRLEQLALTTMRSRLRQRMETAPGPETERLAGRVLAMDALDESTHRLLMEHYMRTRNFGAALRQFRLCQQTLRHELGVAPEAQTRALYHRLLQMRSRPGGGLGADRPEVIPETTREAARNRALPGRDTARQPHHASVLAVAFDSEAGGEPGLEALHERSQRAQRAIKSVADRFGGRIAQRLGDITLLLFGIPHTRGDDMQRASRAALALQQVEGCRGALCSGRVLLCRSEQGNPEVSGHPITLATQWLGHARPGQTLLSDSFHDAVADWVQTEPGPNTPDLGPSHILRRLSDLLELQPRTRLLGRSRELLQLRTALQSCADSGSGQCWLLRGEAGIGKTRLTQELMTLAKSRGFACHWAQFFGIGAGTGAEALRRLSRSCLDWPEQLQVTEPHSPIQQALSRFGFSESQAVFLNDLAEAPQPVSMLRVLDAMDDATRTRGRLGALGDLVAGVAAERPLLLVLEDVHWADPPTLQYLVTLASTAREHPILLLMTSRTEAEPDEPAWRGFMQNLPLTILALAPLREPDAVQLAGELGAEEAATARRCAARAGGNPLFLEQLLCMGRDADGELPDSIRSLVWARLDRLQPEDRRAVQAASILGQRFSPEALRRVLGHDDYDWEPLLVEGLLRPDVDGLVFAHALIRDGIYGSMLKSNRSKLHLRAAEFYAGREESRRAAHLERAGDPAAAAAAYLAGARALTEGYHYPQALELLRRAQTLGAEQVELALLRGDIQRKTGALGDARASFGQALSNASADLQRCRALIGLTALHSLRGDHEQGLDTLEQAARLAQGSDWFSELSQIHYHHGNLLFPLGRLEECLEAHRKALDQAQKAGSVLLKARALSGLGDAYYQRGWMATAFRSFDRCLGLAASQGLGRIEAANLPMRAVTRFYLNELAASREEALEAIALAEQVENRRALCIARNVLSLLQLHQAQWHAAATSAEASLKLARDLGTDGFVAENLCNLGLACQGLGDFDGARGYVAEALALAVHGSAAYVGAFACAASAYVAERPRVAREALARGEALLRSGAAVSHSYLHFCQYAIETALRLGDGAAVQHYADLLQDYTAAESLPWADFLIARARCLAPRGSRTLADVKKLLERGRQVGFLAALPALEAAAAECPPTA